MTELRPFRGLRYNPEKSGEVGLVAAPPYDVISLSDRARYISASPYNVVRLILPSERHVLDGTDTETYQRAARLLAEWVKEEQLGYMLHVDCSSEHKSDTVFVAYDRTSEIVLVSEKISSERLPFLVPVLQKVKQYMGDPVSSMSDMGLPITKAIAITVLGTVPLACSSDPAPSPPPTLPSEVRWVCDGVTRYPDSRIALGRIYQFIKS